MNGPTEEELASLGIVDEALLPDEIVRPVGQGSTDGGDAYDGGWEEALDEGDGFEDHLLGEKPVVPEL